MSLHIEMTKEKWLSLGKWIGLGFSFLCAQGIDKSSYRLNLFLRYEMYAGQFPQSSAFPNSMAGSIMSTGWGFGGDYLYTIGNGLQLEAGFGMELWKKLYAQAGEALKGFTYMGGWSSPPVPHDTYYHGTMVKLRLGAAWAWHKKAATSLGGRLQLGSYTTYFGSASGSVRYSESASGVGVGYYLRWDIGWPIYAQERRIFLPSVFFMLDYLPARPVEFKDFIWVGVTHRVEQQLFGVAGGRIGVAFTL
ncbi:MAG: hypothetical protein KatS3mg025_0848 [Bacteroidia bacterium]|nr:MAG: hypothetical protein KatS3mg025_0848 [Bacteroidia bacterium]